jgi:hypothetical protein
VNLPVLPDGARTPLYLAVVLAAGTAVLVWSVTRVRRAARRTPAAVVTATLGALLCTAYSGDTSWRFARDHLGMHSISERGMMFGAAELGLFAMALMARQNLTSAGAPGTPGVLVWVVTGVQVIPAYSETGPVAGTVRAFVGPVLAALLWHLAMGIELRHHKPGAASQGLLAVLGREIRERLLSWLGLSVRGRDAAQITRDRWTRIATRRAAHLADLTTAGVRPWRTARARRRLAVAVDRTDAGVLAEQRTVLLDRLAAYRGAAALASMDLPAPWATVGQSPMVEVEPRPRAVDVERVPDAVPEAYPAIEQAVPDVPAAVPAGARLLPPVAHPEPSEYAADAVARMVRGNPPNDPLHALRDRIGDERFNALWPEPEQEPDDDSPPPPAEDTLTATARRDFLADLLDGRTPGIRALKERYSVGQSRATRIRDELKAALA